MSTKKILIFIIAILSSGMVKSQTGGTIGGSVANRIEQQLSEYYNNFINSKIGDGSVMSYEKIEGDPYLYKDFVKGTIKFEKDKNIVGKLRYNMYSDEIEFIYHDYKLILVYEDSFSGITLGEYNFIQLPDPKKNDNKPGYFIYLTNGNYDLLVKKSVRFIEEEKPKIMVESKPGRFEKNPNKYFLMSDNNELYEINSVNKLKKYSNDLELFVNEFIADNKLRINTESLTAFFTWVNTK